MSVLKLRLLAILLSNLLLYKLLYIVFSRRLELLSRRKSPSKKSPRKTPRKSPRKTPRKSPRIKGRTPTSSSKKRLALQFKMFTDNEDAVPSTSSSSSSFRASGSKRALFQSPDHDSSLRLLAPSKLIL